MTVEALVQMLSAVHSMARGVTVSNVYTVLPYFSCKSLSPKCDTNTFLSLKMFMTHCAQEAYTDMTYSEK